MNVRNAHLPTTPVGRYGSGAIAYHWTTALLVAIVGAIGLFFDDYPKPQFLGLLISTEN
jgi:cytochrome b561